MDGETFSLVHLDPTYLTAHTLRTLHERVEEVSVISEKEARKNQWNIAKGYVREAQATSGKVMFRGRAATVADITNGRSGTAWHARDDSTRASMKLATAQVAKRGSAIEVFWRVRERERERESTRQVRASVIHST
jgi:hypothetical protein